MGNKAYVINILQELEGEVKEAKGLLILLEMGMMNEDNIDTVIMLLKNALKTTKDNQKIQNIEQNIQKLEKMKQEESSDKNEEMNSLERLLSNL
ncbi:MAG: hypothetical protein N4A38_03200 [Candidatus Gracilibacteria bacterium]|nr:hypothetical protein [Candidatus Gracilibacteria bacterium]